MKDKDPITIKNDESTNPEKPEKPQITKKKRQWPYTKIVLSGLKKNLNYLIVVYAFLILNFIAELWGGNILLPILMIFFCWIISKRLIKIAQMVKEIQVGAVVDEKSKWHDKIISWQVFLRIGCWITAIFITISFFLFFNTIGIFYKIILFLDALLIVWLTKKLKSPLRKHLKEKASNLIGGLSANFLNVFILFVIYVGYSLVFGATLESFERGTIDPNIPLWVKQNINHSCDIFEKLLRFYKNIEITIENAISIKTWIHIIYKIFHLLTMSFWPFMGITLFYRYFLRDKPPLEKTVSFNQNIVNGEANEI